MKANEADIETLELYLDEELSTNERSALETRLAADPRLANELTRLRGDRELRYAIFSGGSEFSAKSIDELVASVRVVQASEALRDRRQGRQGPWRTIASAAAALIVGVVLGGFASHRGPTSPGMNAGMGLPLGSSNTSAGFTPVNLPTAEVPQAYGQHIVVISDPSGRVVQRLVFPTVEAAQQYVEEFRKQSGKIDVRTMQQIKVMSESY